MINYIIFAIIGLLIAGNLYFRSRIFKLSKSLNDKGIQIPIGLAFNETKLKAELSKLNDEDGEIAMELMATMKKSFLIFAGIFVCLLLLYFMR